MTYVATLRVAPGVHSRLLQTRRMSASILTLPVEIFAQILVLLSPASLVQVSKVSTEWNEVVADDAIWRVRRPAIPSVRHAADATR